MTQIVLSFAIVLMLTSISSLNSFAFQEEVDWMWNDVKARARGGGQCKNFIVKAGPPKIL